MARSLARASAFPVFLALLGVTALVTLAGSAVAQDDEEGGAPAVDYAVTVHEATSGGSLAWDVTQFSAPAGSTVMLIYNSEGATSPPHNANPYQGAAETIKPADPPISETDGARTTAIFVMPDSGEVLYRCDVHPEMQGTITVGTFGAGGGGAPHLVEEGVNFLAHWVGVIAFATLFVMYGVAFFLFKYNETPFATDHKDRAVAAGAGTDVYGQDVRVSRMTAVLLGVVLTALAILFVWAVATNRVL